MITVVKDVTVGGTRRSERCGVETCAVISTPIKFVDLFAGIGGIRLGFEQAAADFGYDTECVLTSEIKPHAIKILRANHPEDVISGDITQIRSEDIPDFDILLGGFPCQAFSAAGKRLGFEDTRGTLFFEVARILRDKRPQGFLLENVEGLVKHDAAHGERMGKTLRIILATLEELGYRVAWKVLNARDFGVPQDRKRIYIVGSLHDEPLLTGFPQTTGRLEGILEHGVREGENSFFCNLLLDKYKVQELYGKKIGDKRGGKNNIHSWDLELKGKVTPAQKMLLEALLRARRRKHWAECIGIEWMDGMPLTADQIKTFFHSDTLESDLEYLTTCGYLAFEHPKRKVGRVRVADSSLPKGYNIVSGKLSFEVSAILDPKGYAPTVVATDVSKMRVFDGGKLRSLTMREGLRLFGFPDSFLFDIERHLGFDLLGNTVVVPVIKAVAKKLLNSLH